MPKRRGYCCGKQKMMWVELPTASGSPQCNQHIGSFTKKKKWNMSHYNVIKSS